MRSSSVDFKYTSDQVNCREGENLVEIKEMVTRREIKEFVKFPEKLYRDEPNWVPEIFMDEMNNLDRKKNPAFDYCEAKYFMAYRDGESVGELPPSSATKRTRPGNKTVCASHGWILSTTTRWLTRFLTRWNPGHERRDATRYMGPSAFAIWTKRACWWRATIIRACSLRCIIFRIT